MAVPHAQPLTPQQIAELNVVDAMFSQADASRPAAPLAEVPWPAPGVGDSTLRPPAPQYDEAAAAQWFDQENTPFTEADVSNNMVAQTAAPEPSMPPAPELSVTLPRGLWDPRRKIFLPHVVVRELTGADEEIILRAKNNLEMIDSVVSLGIERAGDLVFDTLTNAQRSQFAGTLLSGEAVMVYMKVVEATFGNKRTYDFVCVNPSCQRELEVDVLLDQDFPVVVPPNTEYNTSYTFTTRGGAVLTYRMLTSADETEMLQKQINNNGEMNSYLMTKALLEVNGKPVLDARNVVRELGMKDRVAFMEVISSRQPRVDLNTTVECVCGHSNSFTLGLPQLFLGGR